MAHHVTFFVIMSNESHQFFLKNTLIAFPKFSKNTQFACVSTKFIIQAVSSSLMFASIGCLISIIKGIQLVFKDIY